MHRWLRLPALLRARKHLPVLPAGHSFQAHLLWHLAPAQLPESLLFSFS